MIAAVFQICIILCVAEKQRPHLDDYCKYSKMNTPCLYKCKLADECHGQAKPFKPLEYRERMVILDLHNKYRNQLAGGMYKNENFPAASNMMVLSYDKECEFITTCYLFQCIWKHDTARITLKGEDMGQNLYTASFSTPKPIDDEFLTRAYVGWFNEYKLINDTYKHLLHNYSRTEGLMVGHFVQNIWYETEMLGCAMMLHRRKYPKYTRDVYCNYRPPGCARFDPMYIPGPPASKCPGGIVNDRYPNLCGKIRPMRDDDYLAPVGFEDFITETVDYDHLEIGDGGEDDVINLPPEDSSSTILKNIPAILFVALITIL